MSNKPQTNLDLDLDLHFLPAWAQQSANVNRYADFEGVSEDREGRRRSGRDDRRERRPGGPRPQGRGPEGGERQARSGWDHGRDSGSEGRDYRRRGPDRDANRNRPSIPLPDIDVMFQPENKGAEALARQIKLTGRAYPLFDIAHLVLKKPERYIVILSVRKKADGQIAQPIYLCNLDETLWVSEPEAVDHILNRHFATFYQADKIPTDPPKGKYTFVAQCGMSGIILGPPNYHDYQPKLLRLHAERFGHMPFEVFKSRVRIVRDEAVVKQWIDEQSFRTEFSCLNVPEPLRLATREEVERHFREVHIPNVVQQVETYTLTSMAARSLPCRGLQALVRRSFEDQRRFPLRVVNTLSHQFANQGLHFFKVNKSVTHVCVARPRYLDLVTTAVSEGVKKVIQYIDTHPRTTRRQLIEALVPAAVASATELPAAASQPAPAAQTDAVPGATQEAAAPAPEPTAPPPSPEVANLISDLHWLMHEGHVIEFANGVLETAKKPAPKVVKPAPARPSPAMTAVAVNADASAGGATETVATIQEVGVEGVTEEITASIESQPSPLSGAELGQAAAPAQTAPTPEANDSTDSQSQTAGSGV
jgi:hypothetical protein